MQESISLNRFVERMSSIQFFPIYPHIKIIISGSVHAHASWCCSYHQRSVQRMGSSAIEKSNYCWELYLGIILDPWASPSKAGSN